MAAKINADALLDGASAVEEISSGNAYAPIEKATDNAEEALVEVTRHHEWCLNPYLDSFYKISSNSNGEMGLLQCFEKLRLFASTLTELANMYKNIESTDADKRRALENFINTNIPPKEDPDKKDPSKSVVTPDDTVADLYDNTGATVVSVAGATFDEDTRPRIEITPVTPSNDKEKEETQNPTPGEKPETPSDNPDTPSDNTGDNSNTGTDTDTPSTGDDNNNTNTGNDSNNTKPDGGNNSNNNTGGNTNTGSGSNTNHGNTSRPSGNTGNNSGYYVPGNNNGGGTSSTPPTTPSAGENGNASTTTPSAPDSDAGIIDNSGEELDVISIDKGSSAKPSTSSNDGGSVIPAILGVGVAGAAGVAGVKYIKNKKEKDNEYEDDSINEDENSFSYIGDYQENIDTSNDSYNAMPTGEKYKAGNVNKLVLDDAPENIKIEESMNDTTNQKEELE